MAAETQYTANLAMVTVSTANSALDGSGTISTVITGASNGTLIKTLTIKAIENTTQGMIRFFIDNNTGTNRLFREIEVPAVTKSANVPAFEVTIPLYFTLKAGYILKAATENAQSFNIIAEGQDWTYYASSVRAETTRYTINTNGVTISTANTNLNGTGTMGNCVVPTSHTHIISVIIKAKQATTDGMIRLFLYDGTNTKLFKEIPVRAVTPSATAQSFYHKIMFDDLFVIKGNWILKVATEKAEAFNVITETYYSWTYPA